MGKLVRAVPREKIFMIDKRSRLECSFNKGMKKSAVAAKSITTLQFGKSFDCLYSWVTLCITSTTQITPSARMSKLFPKVNTFLILFVACYFLIILKNFDYQVDELKYNVNSLKKIAEAFDEISAIKQKLIYINKQIFDLEMEHKQKLKSIIEKVTSAVVDRITESPHWNSVLANSLTMRHEIPIRWFNLLKMDTKTKTNKPDKTSKSELSYTARSSKERNISRTHSANTVKPNGNKEKTAGDAKVSNNEENRGHGRSRRTKRSSGRGNVNSRNHGGGKKCPKCRNNRQRRERKGIVAAHFQGAVPDVEPRDEGLIAPWFLDENVTNGYSLTRFIMRDGNGSVQVTKDGLYFIYAQAYYITNETLNSFTINLRSTDKESIPIASCSASAYLRTSLDLSEISCFTATVRFLNANQIIFLRQREFHRRLIMREGFTFLGLVRLQSQNSSICRQC